MLLCLWEFVDLEEVWFLLKVIYWKIVKYLVERKKWVFIDWSYVKCLNLFLGFLCLKVLELYNY